MYSRWNPLAEFDALRREIDRVFQGYSPSGWSRPYSAFLPGSAARSYPLVNVTEKPEEYVVEALAPGLDPDSLDVTVKANTLTISGEKKALEGVEPEQYHRNERATGKFVRTLTLGAEIDEKKVVARYTNGLLVVTLPRAESAKPKRVAVSVK